MNQNKLRQNIIYNAVYQVMKLFIPVFTIPYLSRVLAVEQIGINSYTLSIIQVFIIFSFFGINNYGGREIARTSNLQDRNKQFWSIWLLQLFWTFCSFICFIVLNNYFFIAYRNIFFIQSFLILINGFEISWFFIGIEEFKRVVVRNTVIKIISTPLIFILIKDQNDFILYIILNVITTLIGNLILMISVRKYISKFSFDFKLLLIQMKESFLFFVPQIAILMYTTLDKTILGALSTMNQVSYYEQSQKFVRMAITLVTSAGVVIMPRMTNYIKSKEWDKFEQLFEQSFCSVNLISCYTVTIIMSVSSSFVIWFFGEEYAVVVQLMRITAVIGIFIPLSTMLWNIILIPLNQEKVAIKSAIYSAVISLSLNLILVSKLGALGAVITLCFVEFFNFAYRMYYTNKYYSLSKYQTVLVKNFLICIGIVIIVNQLTLTLPATLLTTVIQGALSTLLFSISFIVFKDKFFISIIKKVFNYIKR